MLGRFWNIKPPLGAQINRGHSLANGLMLAILPNSNLPSEMVSNQTAVLAAGTPTLVAKSTEGLALGGSTVVKYTTQQTGFDKITTTGSIFMIARNPTPAPSFGTIIKSVDDIASGITRLGFSFDHNSLAGPNMLYVLLNGSGFNTAANSLGANAELRFHRVGMTFNATTLTFYVNGINDGGQSTGGVTPPSDANRATKLFVNDFDDTPNNNGEAVLIYAWNRMLTDAEMALLYRQPYCLFQPLAKNYFPFAQVAAGGFDVLIESRQLAMQSGFIGRMYR